MSKSAIGGHRIGDTKGPAATYKLLRSEPTLDEGLREALRRQHLEETHSSSGICSGCGGRRWVEDENWQPDDPRTWKGERSHGDGLIPCGFCNEAGWDTPDWAAQERETTT